MKPIAVTGILFAIALPLSADTPLEKELAQLNELHEKALAAAVEPVNRQYQRSLEQLLHRTTLVNDLATAEKIKAILGGNTPTVVTKQQAASANFPDRIIGNRWAVPGEHSLKPAKDSWIQFEKDGKIQIGWQPEKGEWKVKDANSVEVTLGGTSTTVDVMSFESGFRNALYQKGTDGKGQKWKVARIK